jgi:glycosyltransferase involved in cell wall biosynthesis
MTSTPWHMADNSTPALSVIICSRDRNEQLRTCLEHMARAGAHFHREWELIIVDNGSSADLERFLCGVPQPYDLPFRIICEPVPGLARARNRGLRDSNGSIIAFTDDDCLVDENWLERIYVAFEQNSDLALLGGRVDAPEVDAATLAVRPFAQSQPIRSLADVRQYLIGCNSAMRRSVALQIGEFDIRLGAGAPARSAEDIDYFYRVLLNKGEICYDASCRIVHAHGRSAPEDIRGISANYLFGRGFWYAKRVLKRDYIFVRYLYWELRSPGETTMKLKLLQGFICGLIDYTVRNRGQLLD